MKLSELFEYRLFKNDAGFKIYMNPSASDIRALLKNSYILSKLPNIDLNAPINKLDDIDDDYVHHGGQIHGLDYPLRGIVIDNTVYIVDSYDADHEDLVRILRKQGIEIGTYDSGGVIHSVPSIPIVIEKTSTSPRNNLEDYMIGTPQEKVNTLKSMPVVTRMKMPIGEWN